MRKIGMVMAIVLATVIALGCYNRQFYLKINWNEEGALDDFTVSCCNTDDFEPYFQEKALDEDEVDSWQDGIVSMESSAIYGEYSSTEINGTENSLIEVTTGDDDSISYAVEESDESEGVWVDPKQEIMDALSEADYVLKVTCEGNLSVSAGMTIQEVTVTEACSGEKSLNGRTIQIISISDYGIITAGGLFANGTLIGGCTNLMKEGKEYLLFCNDIGSDELYMEVSELSYFALEDVENVISESAKPLYAELKENEFFAEDQETLDILLEIKQEALGVNDG